jgi:hypothetical protein
MYYYLVFIISLLTPITSILSNDTYPFVLKKIISFSGGRIPDKFAIKDND